MEYEKGKKLIIINNIVVWTIFTIITLNNGGVRHGVAAITYYYVNKLILLKKDNIEKEIVAIDNDNIDLNYNEVDSKTQDKQLEGENKENINEEDEKNLKVDRKFCGNCGKIIDSSWAYCNHCGDKLK